MLLEQLLRGPLLDPENKRQPSNSRRQLFNSRLLVLRGVIIPPLLHEHESLAPVLFTPDGLLDVHGLFGLLLRFRRLLPHELVERLLVVHAGSGEAVHAIAEVVIAGLAHFRFLGLFRFAPLGLRCRRRSHLEIVKQGVNKSKT